MAQQTSVEYLVSIVQKCIAPDYIPTEIIQQAKEMHNKELGNAYQQGWKDAEKTVVAEIHKYQ